MNTKVKRPSGWAASHRLVSLENVRRVIIEDQFDGGVGRIGGVDLLEKAYELPRAMPILDTGENLAGEQVDPGQQA